MIELTFPVDGQPVTLKFPEDMPTQMMAESIERVKSALTRKELTLVQRLVESAANHVGGVSAGEVVSESRAKLVVAARHCVFALLREIGWSFPSIAREFGMDRRTIMVAVVKMQTPTEFERKVMDAVRKECF